MRSTLWKSHQQAVLAKLTKFALLLKSAAKIKCVCGFLTAGPVSVPKFSQGCLTHFLLPNRSAPALVWGCRLVTKLLKTPTAVSWSVIQKLAGEQNLRSNCRFRKKSGKLKVRISC